MRMVVIPEDIYFSLLNQNKTLANPLDAHIIETTNRMNEILQDPNFDDSTKFQLYSDELKRLQKVRADRTEMPTNVNIKNISPDLLHSATDNISNALVEKLNETTNKTVKKSRKSAKSSSNEANSSATIDDSSERDDSLFETPLKATKSPLTKKSPRAERKENFEKLRKYLNENRQKFGIREDGKIFKDDANRVVYKYSNFENVARALTGLSSKRPSGMNHLRAAIQKDEIVKPLILNFDDSPQKGEGKIKNIIHDVVIPPKKSDPNKCLESKKGKPTKHVRFCPEIWK